MAQSRLFRHGFKSNATRLAHQVREQLGLGLFDAFDPTVACKTFDIELIELSRYLTGATLEHASYLRGRAGRSSFSAVVLSVGGMRRVIIYNDAHSDSRQRSNIGHELAHCFLGHPITSAAGANGERAYDAAIEREAHFMGGVLLLTDEAAVEIAASGISEEEACRRYGVSKDMLTFRMRLSGAHVRAQRRLKSQ